MSSTFIKKLYLMINECDNNIEWIDENSFIIHNPDKLHIDMKNYFKNSKIKSFVRQLHFYHFKKIGGTRYVNWIYSNKYFTKDGSMLDKIKRNTSNNNEELLEEINEINKRCKILEDKLKLQETEYQKLAKKLELQEARCQKLANKLKLQETALKNEKLEKTMSFLRPFFEPTHKKRCKIDILDPDLLI